MKVGVPRNNRGDGSSPSDGWKNTFVRDVDGRTGRITEEWPGFMHVGVKIETHNGDTELVQLNVDGPDSGAIGWQWYCENLDGGSRWLWLGDHNKSKVTS